MRKTTCIKCQSEDVEDRYVDEKSNIRYFVCLDCGAKFSSYDSFVAYKLKEKLLAIQDSEATFQTVVSASVDALFERGITKYLDQASLQEIVNSGGGSQLDTLSKIAYLEAMVSNGKY